MMRRGIRYKQLSRMLEQLGIYEPSDHLNRKVNRKRLAAFLIACLRVMGVETIALHSLNQGQNNKGQTTDYPSRRPVLPQPDQFHRRLPPYPPINRGPGLAGGQRDE